MSATRDAAERGLTLVELMIGVAIIGVLASAATITMDTEPDTFEIGTRLSNKIGECVRLAQASGPVRDNVAVTGVTQRARLLVSSTDDFTQQTIALQLLVEDDLPANTATWQPVSSMTTGRAIQLVGYRDETELESSGDGPATYLGGSDTLAINCFPNGSTAARTLYLAGNHGGELVRVAVFPLTGETFVAKRW